MASFCDATDKRDMIYAMLGMATDAERALLYVSYTESTSEVYHRTAKLLVEQGSGIELLYEAACYSYLKGLPSWAPNWAGDRPLETLGRTYKSGDEPTFRAAGSAKCRISISPDTRLLYVRAIHVDTIKVVTEPLKFYDNTSLDMKRFNSLWAFEQASRALVQNNAHNIRYSTADRIENALWRTLVCDVTKNAAGDLTRPAPSSFANSYLAFLRLQDLVTDPNTSIIERTMRESQPFMRAFEPSARGRRFCVTLDGFVGLVPARAQKGDGICVFLGGAVPFVIRDTNNGNASLVGDCYVHGLMDGEALDMVLDVDGMLEQDTCLE